MIYTSYFNNRIVRESKLKKYSIALIQFTNYQVATDLLLPKSDFLKYKNGVLTLDALKSLYNSKVLSKLDAEEISIKYQDSILLCHEVRGCHRDELREWLISNGVECEEL